ncbi:hypothetical protein Tco_0554600 [Tanacetum coccineum]
MLHIDLFGVDIPIRVNEARGAKDTLGTVFWESCIKDLESLHFGTIVIIENLYYQVLLISCAIDLLCNALGYSHSAATQFGGVTDWYQSQDSVISSASSAVTYTSVYTDSEPGRVFWGADEELSDRGPEHPPSPVEVPYVPEPEYPEYLVPSDDEAPMEDQHLPVDASPVALSPGYVADSDPEEDLEEDPEGDHADYLADGVDDDDEPSDDDDDDIGDGDEEHLAPADSPAAPVIDHVPSAKDTEAFETDKAAPTPIPSPRRHTTRMSVRPQTPVPLPSGVEVERLLALPIPPPSPLTPLSSPLPQIPSPPLPPPPSSLHLPPPVPTSLPLPLSPLPPSLFIPPVDRREDIPEDESPPRKRLCSTAPASRYKVGESSTATPRPTRGHRVDYEFIDTLDAKTR